MIQPARPRLAARRPSPSGVRNPTQSQPPGQTRPVLNAALCALVVLSILFNGFGLLVLLSAMPEASFWQIAAKIAAIGLGAGLLLVCEAVGFLGLESAREAWRARDRLPALAALVFTCAAVAVNAGAAHNAVSQIEALISLPAARLDEEAARAQREAARLEAEQAVLRGRLERLEADRAADTAVLAERLRATPPSHSSNAAQQASLFIAARQDSAEALAALETRLVDLASQADAARTAQASAEAAARHARLAAPEALVWLVVGLIEALKAFGRPVFAIRPAPAQARAPERVAPRKAALDSGAAPSALAGAHGLEPGAPPHTGRAPADPAERGAPCAHPALRAEPPAGPARPVGAGGPGARARPSAKVIALAPRRPPQPPSPRPAPEQGDLFAQPGGPGTGAARQA